MGSRARAILIGDRPDSPDARLRDLHWGRHHSKNRYQQRVSQAEQLFELTLRVIVSRVESSHVISEGGWTQRQIVQARELLGPDPLFVILRIDERETAEV
jgi:hypothetical protein